MPLYNPPSCNHFSHHGNLICKKVYLKPTELVAKWRQSKTFNLEGCCKNEIKHKRVSYLVAYL